VIKDRIIVGCQTFGSSVEPANAHRIIQRALDSGLTRFDLAERYPFPESRELIGKTESIFGDWITSNRSEKISITTKVSGRSDNGWFSDEGRLTPARIKKAFEDSLLRLKVEHIDCFLLHWPDRFTNIFGRKFYRPDSDPRYIPVEEQAGALLDLVSSGRVTEIGVSNETPWGLMKFIQVAREIDLPFRVNQEEYSILNRNIERGHSEILLREGIKFQAYAVLAGGILTGKYFDLNKQSGRLNELPEHTRRHREIRDRILRYETREYEALRDQIYEKAIAYVLSRDFVHSAVIGINNLPQLERLITAVPEIGDLAMMRDDKWNDYESLFRQYGAD